MTSDFADCRYYMTFKGPYISILLEARVTLSGMHGSPVFIVHADNDLDPIQGHGASEGR